MDYAISHKSFCFLLRFQNIFNFGEETIYLSFVVLQIKTENLSSPADRTSFTGKMKKYKISHFKMFSIVHNIKFTFLLL